MKRKLRELYMQSVTGRGKGVAVSLFRGMLNVFAFFFGLISSMRYFCYRVGLFHRTKLPCPVISVGNITAGGTGKTPLVEWLVEWCLEQNLKVVILTRGYGKSKSAETDDEDFVTALNSDQVMRFVGRNRVKNAHRAIKEFEPDVIVLDDGFQHFRIERDLDIVTIDSTIPFSNGQLIPAGLLREPPRALARADFIVYTRVDQVDVDVLETLKAKVETLTGPISIAQSTHRIVHVRTDWNGKIYGSEWLKNKRLFGFCGIGNPRSFVRTIQSAGGELVRHRIFPDHHPYSQRDVIRIESEAREFMSDFIVTTEKDSRRLQADDFQLTLASVKVALDMISGKSELQQLLHSHVCDREEVPSISSSS